MIRIYCRAHHTQGSGLCQDCRELRDYSRARLDECPFGEDKPPCKKCEAHCFDPTIRERIREVMRYSGPRMLFVDIFSWMEHKIKVR